MKLRTLILILLPILALLVWWSYQWLFPNEKEVIIQRLHDLAALVSVEPDQGGISRIASSQRLPGYFTPEIEINIEVGRQQHQVQGSREQLMQYMLRIKREVRRLSVRFLDITVDLTPDGTSATAHLTVLGDVNEQKNFLVQEVKFNLVKLEGDWAVSRVETIRTLER